MQITPNRRLQQNQIQKIAGRCDAFQFFNLLTNDKLLDTVEMRSPDFRERLFPPTETLSLFLAQCMSQDGSCQNILNEFAMARLAGGLPACSNQTGGYCRARKRLPVSMARGLCQTIGQQVSEHIPASWRWRSHRVRLVDGTTLFMPDTAENQALWPQQSRQAEGQGFPVVRVVGITCWANGVLIDAAMGAYKRKGTSENSLLRRIESTLSAGDLLMGDAIYSSYYLLASMQRQGVEILVEQNGARKSKTDFRTGKSLGKRDHIVTIKRAAQRPT